MSTVGSRIRKARKARGYTQDELAEKCRVGRSSVARWETDVVMPGRDAWRYLLSALDVSHNWLRNDTGKMDDPDKPAEVKESSAEYDTAISPRGQLHALIDKLSDESAAKLLEERNVLVELARLKKAGNG